MAADKATGHQFNPCINGLRAFAMLMVLVTHVMQTAAPQGFVLPFLSGLNMPEQFLDSGVDLFFMISGYLIAGSVLRHGNAVTFMRDRVWRIYPVFLAIQLPLFPIAWATHWKWFEGMNLWGVTTDFIEETIFAPGVMRLHPLQPQAWSLSYEFAFYLVSAAVFVLWRERQVWALRLALWVVIPVLLYMYPRAVFFPVGALVYMFERRGWLRMVPRGLGAFCAAAFFYIMVKALETPMFQLGPRDFLHLVSDMDDVYDRQFLAYAAVVPGFVLFADIVRGAPWCRWLLASRPMQFLGAISYSVYMCHPLPMFVLKKVFTKFFLIRLQWTPEQTGALFMLVAMAAAIGFGYASYLLIEKKLTAFLRHKWDNDYKARTTPVLAGKAVDIVSAE